MNKIASQLGDFARAGADFHQLSEPVPTVIQTLFHLRYQLALNEPELTGEDYDVEQLIAQVRACVDDEHSLSDFLSPLAQLATTQNIRALRFVEEILPELSKSKRWMALLAQFALKLSIMQDLVDAPQVALASALGGQDMLIRLDGFVLQEHLEPWVPYQRELLGKTMQETCSSVGGKVEQEWWGDEYYGFRLLLPLTADTERLLRGVIEEVREYGLRTHRDMLVTNGFPISAELIEARIAELRTGEARSFQNWIEAVRTDFDPELEAIIRQYFSE